ncbi:MULTISPECIES: ArsR/SmtB family transcription factor [Paenibacillus]|uniref:Transcriptional regulator n=1 Tax=Paenibacillus albilobatus TaxID=2716884 RepID=A0A920CBK4_9BACL|nr:MULTISPECIES: metalloregulator ArsR/SmtB family transcription factor [Paenibacillus]GIO33490.1 transcriptional regulator [Paenibacillus albilobatus]
MDITTLSALADPTRLQIVELLREGSLTVGEIADRLHIRQPQVSKHLKVLNESHIVEVRPEANRRFYKLRPEPLQEMESWLKTFHSLWEDRLDRLDEYLQELQKDHLN